MIKREQALLNFCQRNERGVTEKDIVKSSNGDYVYKTPLGEFAVVTNDEANELYKSMIKEAYESDGLATFGSKEFKEKMYAELITIKDKDKFIEEIIKLPTAFMNNNTQTIIGINPEIIESTGLSTTEKLSYGADRYIEKLIEKGILEIDFERIVKELLNYEERKDTIVNLVGNDRFKDEYIEEVEDEKFYIYFQ